MSKKFTGFEKLVDVHPDLALLIERGQFGCPFGFKVIEGVRSRGKQQQLYDEDKTPTLNSRHLLQPCCWEDEIKEYGHAVDLMVYDENGVGTWDVEKYYRPVMNWLQRVAFSLNIDVVFGINWPSVDAVHIELAWESYDICDERGCVDCGPTLPDEFLDRKSGTSPSEIVKPVAEAKEANVMNGEKHLLQSKGINSLLVAALALVLQKLGIGADPETLLNLILQVLTALGIGGGLFGRYVATTKLRF